ncbi:MAG: hypothetical protein NWF06_01960 [Candidatus Bathyarchaeota archaeon]|nr:hypothetical protein [Candidatus Bathyarchaeum sp.]
MELGLTSVQAKIYLTLIENGASTAQEISKRSGVPRQEVYRTMPQLLKRNLVTTILDLPKKWKAISLQNGIELLLKRKDDETIKLHNKARKLLDNFENKNKRAELPSDGTEFVIIPGGKNHLRWIRKKISQAKSSNDIFVPVKLFRHILHNDSENFIEPLRRGVKYRHIFFTFDIIKHELEFEPYLQNNPNFQVRYLSNVPFISTVLIDKKEVVFSQPAHDILQSPKLWSKNSSFAKLIEFYFETMWNQAQEYKLK